MSENQKTNPKLIFYYLPLNTSTIEVPYQRTLTLSLNVLRFYFKLKLFSVLAKIITI